MFFTSEMSGLDFPVFWGRIVKLVDDDLARKKAGQVKGFLLGALILCFLNAIFDSNARETLWGGKKALFVQSSTRPPL